MQQGRGRPQADWADPAYDPRDPSYDAYDRSYDPGDGSYDPGDGSYDARDRSYDDGYGYDGRGYEPGYEPSYGGYDASYASYEPYEAQAPWDGGLPETDPRLKYREPGPGMPGYRGSREHRHGGDRR
jgi:hypothetical protein